MLPLKEPVLTVVCMLGSVSVKLLEQCGEQDQFLSYLQC